MDQKTYEYMQNRIKKYQLAQEKLLNLHAMKTNVESGCRNKYISAGFRDRPTVLHIDFNDDQRKLLANSILNAIEELKKEVEKELEEI